MAGTNRDVAVEIVSPFGTIMLLVKVTVEAVTVVNEGV
jgi:hypothetical protein